MQKHNVIIGFFLLFCIPFSSAYGYVLKGPHVLDIMVDKIGSATDLTLRQKVTVYNTRFKNGYIEYESTAYYSLPDKYRVESTVNNTKMIFISNYNKSIRVVDNRIESEYESGFDHYKDVLLFRNRLMLTDRLQDLGINLQSTELTRYYNGIAFMLGEKNGESPYLLVDKDAFRPVLWVLKDNGIASDKAHLEVRYLDWKRTEKVWLPFHMEFYKNSILVKEIKLINVAVDKRLKANLFDIKALKKKIKTLTENETKKKADQNTTDTIDGLDRIIDKDRLAF